MERERERDRERERERERQRAKDKTLLTRLCKNKKETKENSKIDENSSHLISNSNI
jgi:hypothetical protein